MNALAAGQQRPRLQSKRFQNAPNVEGCLLDGSKAQALSGSMSKIMRCGRSGCWRRLPQMWNSSTLVWTPAISPAKSSTTRCGFPYRTPSPSGHHGWPWARLAGCASEEGLLQVAVSIAHQRQRPILNVRQHLLGDHCVVGGERGFGHLGAWIHDLVRMRQLDADSSGDLVAGSRLAESLGRLRLLLRVPSTRTRNSDTCQYAAWDSVPCPSTAPATVGAQGRTAHKPQFLRAAATADNCHAQDGGNSPPAAGGEQDSRRSVSIAPAAGRDAGPTVPVRGGPHVLVRSPPAEIAQFSSRQSDR